MTFADNCVAFPVAHGVARIHVRRPRLNAHPVGNAASPIASTAVALAPLALTPQVAPEIATYRLVGVDKLIDPFWRDVERAFQSRPSADLFGAPIEADQPGDFGPLARGDSVSASAGSRALAGKPIRLAGPKTSQTTIARQLPLDRARRTPQNAGNFANCAVGIKHGSNLISFFPGEVRVGHRATPTWWLECRC